MKISKKVVSFSLSPIEVLGRLDLPHMLENPFSLKQNEKGFTLTNFLLLKEFNKKCIRPL